MCTAQTMALTTTTTRVTTTKLATTNTSRCSRCGNGGSWGSTTMGLSRRVCLESPDNRISDVRARAWPKAQAWAGLEWAQACKNPEPGPKPELGLGWAGLGLEPGLFAYHGIMNKYDK